MDFILVNTGRGNNNDYNHNYNNGDNVIYRNKKARNDFW